MLVVLSNFIITRFTVKSSDCRSEILWVMPTYTYQILIVVFYYRCI